MKNLDEVFFDGPGSPAAAFASRHYNRHAVLPEDMRKAANLGLRIFPVSLLAKLKGTPGLFIGAATNYGAWVLWRPVLAERDFGDITCRELRPAKRAGEADQDQCTMFS